MQPHRFSVFKSYILSLLLPAVAWSAPSISVIADHASAIYDPGEKVFWSVDVHDDTSHSIQKASYVLKQGGATVIGKGELTFTDAHAVIETSIGVPGTILAEVSGSIEGQKPVVGLGGVAFAPEKIEPSEAMPSDFDCFWKAKLDELATVPENPVLEPCDCGSKKINYWNITMDNIRGTHIRGQLARPTAEKKYPAMIVFQWAGVYPLTKKYVTDRAAEGWLCLNVNAHDLPIDKPKAFYDEQLKGALKDYAFIGNNDREKSYFLRMFLGCYRAVEYVAQRPDWDGKTLVVSGISQGAFQSLVAAALNPKVTAVTVLVPAGCDHSGATVGRAPGWPGWLNHFASRDDKAKVADAARYYDGVNFAAHIKCPVLVGLGLIDTTATAPGVFAAINQLKGPKEVVVLPDKGHGSSCVPPSAYLPRWAAWREALLAGQPIPIQRSEGYK